MVNLLTISFILFVCNTITSWTVNTKTQRSLHLILGYLHEINVKKAGPTWLNPSHILKESINRPIRVCVDLSW